MGVWYFNLIIIDITDTIGHVQNEQETGYEYSISIELKNGARHLKERPKISLFAKFKSYWFKLEGMVRF